MKSDIHSARKAISISIVIPVYNEAAHLPACLEAIAAQTVLPHEVIVVDNNSTDDTVAIARSYPFVRLLREPRQGVVHARDCGFNAARGAIIGRIDADTIISPEWVERLQAVFADDTVAVVTGSARYHNMALAPLLNKIDLGCRHYLASVLGREVAVQGANMALRRSTWRDIRTSLCRTGGMHEDFDISIHANARGHVVRFDQDLVVSLGCRRTEAGFWDFSKYVMLSPQTYALHGLKSHRHMYPVVALAMIGYFPLKLLHRGYDPLIERFSLIQLLFVPAPAQARVNPATFVD